MFFQESHEPDANIPDDSTDSFILSSSPPPACSLGHRSTLSLRSRGGGTICLLCFSNLVSDPHAPTIHVSYALSQLSHALSDPVFLRSLLSFHAHFLVTPLVHALSSIEDDPIAKQIVDIIAAICFWEESSSVCGDFVEKLSDQLSSRALTWSQRQLYLLHCFGLLMNCQHINLCDHIKNKASLICNLVSGLQLPSEEIRGEILYTLYKLATLQNIHDQHDGTHLLTPFCPKLVLLCLEALSKTEKDDVRLNCVALLTILAREGLFANSRECIDSNYSSLISGDCHDHLPMTESVIEEYPLDILFAEAIKGPLLSRDSQVQISSLDLIFHYLSQGSCQTKQIHVLVEENIADYAFEILRLSECKDPLVNSCLRVLDTLSVAEQPFRQRLVVGFPTIIQVLHYVSQVPFHPFQVHTLKLIQSCVSDFPGVASSSQVKDIALVMTRMLENYNSHEMGLLPDSFGIVCSTFVSLMKSPSFTWTSELLKTVQESIKYAILGSLSFFDKDSSKILHSLYLLNEVYVYCGELSTADDPTFTELTHYIIDECMSNVLPWSLSAFRELDQETILGVIETFNIILLQKSDVKLVEFANGLVEAGWFSFSFGCLGYFSTEKTRWRVYLMLSSLVDVLLEDKGQPIRDAAICLPSDPIDLLFLLRQDSSKNSELSSCQSAVLLILYSSSLYNDRLADDKLVLETLELYILGNRESLIPRQSSPGVNTRLVCLYGLYRGLKDEHNHTPYSLEVENFIFHLLNESECDLQGAKLHSTSLKWLFRQDRLFKGLSYQLLKFCRYHHLNGNRTHIQGESSQRFDVWEIAKLVSDVDNYGATLLVYLLKQLAENGDQETDIVLVLNLMTTIIGIFPAASDQLSLQGVGSAIETLLCSSTHAISEQILWTVLLLLFNILISTQPEALKDDESWVSVSVKLLNNSNIREALANWNCKSPLVIGLFCLFLHQSWGGSLTEVSKHIVQSSFLASTINVVIGAACSKGPALSEYHKGTDLGDSLTFLLLLYFFTLRSLCYVLPEAVDWQAFFDPPDQKQAIPAIKINCHDLCRLIHFGPPLVKLVSSYCLVELFSGLSNQIETKKSEKLNFSKSYLSSVVVTLEGLIFYDDIEVANNCAFCLSIIFGLDDMEMDIVAKNKISWCRLIVEEMAMSLAVPFSASNSPTNHHKPAVHVTVALLKLQSMPGWLRSVFDASCISGTIGNLTAMNVSREIVLLFRELARAKFLNSEHVSALSRVFQACRKQIYIKDPEAEWMEEDIKNWISGGDNQADICKILFHIMMSEGFPYTNVRRSPSKKRELSNEIELFFESLTLDHTTL